jgi:hypothetical protein
MTPARFAPAPQFIDDQFIRIQLLRQENGFAFARAESGFEESPIGHPARGSYFQPERWLGDPSLHLRRGTRFVTRHAPQAASKCARKVSAAHRSAQSK